MISIDGLDDGAALAAKTYYDGSRYLVCIAHGGINYAKIFFTKLLISPLGQLDISTRDGLSKYANASTISAKVKSWPMSNSTDEALEQYIKAFKGTKVLDITIR